MPDNTIDVGPVDLAFIKFTGNRFTGEVAPALLDLARSGTVRVLDALLVSRDADQRVGWLEIADLGPELREAFTDINGQPGAGLLDSEDVAEIAQDLEPDTSALLLVKRPIRRRRAPASRSSLLRRPSSRPLPTPCRR